MIKEVLIFGLGRMGSGIGRRLLKNGFTVFGYDKDEAIKEKAKKDGIKTLNNIGEIENIFTQERKVIWLMVPATVVDSVIDEIEGFLKEGDIVIDGGNSYFRDSMVRYKRLKSKGVGFLDIGVSGGVWGEKEGYCMMIGGDREDFEYIEPVLKALAPKGTGYGYLGKSGAGHFVKMVHNGIEYAMMEAIAEGFELMKESEFDLDLKEVARIYNNGSVIRSWLMELVEKAFEDFGNLDEIKGYVEDTGEGRWTVIEAINSAVPVPNIADSLFMRFRSRQKDSFRDKLLAALRFEFGGHAVKKDEE